MVFTNAVLRQTYSLCSLSAIAACLPHWHPSVYPRRLLSPPHLPSPHRPDFSGNLANAPTFDELWIHFQAILIRIFGKQDGTATAPVGGSGGSGVSTGVYGTGAIEHSWMFAA